MAIRMFTQYPVRDSSSVENDILSTPHPVGMQHSLSRIPMGCHVRGNGIFYRAYIPNGMSKMNMF